MGLPALLPASDSIVLDFILEDFFETMQLFLKKTCKGRVNRLCRTIALVTRFLGRVRARRRRGVSFPVPAAASACPGTADQTDCQETDQHPQTHPVLLVQQALQQE